MHSIRQLLRQPGKTVMGIVLITAAAAALIVCLGQGIAARETEAQLNAAFQTILFPSTEYHAAGDAWAVAYGENHPEVVKEVSAPGFASAYIPQLTPDNYVSHFDSSDKWEYITEPYNLAMLEIILTEIGEPAPGDGESQQGEIAVPLTGTVERVVMLQEDYGDCTGFTARLTLKLPEGSDLEALNLAVGERYLVFCTQYQDWDYLLRAGMCRTLDIELAQWDSYHGLQLFTPEEMENHNSGGFYGKRVGRVRIGNNITYVYDYQVPMYQAVIGTICNPALTLDESYSHPTIVHLEGTVEDFLESSQGELWKEMLENMGINNHCFPVIGVDSTDSLADFARRVAGIAQGRDFTEQELKNGEKVCMISDTVAEKNGLHIGDTLNLQYYENDENLYYQLNNPETLGTNPTASFYFAATTPLETAESYTIVGIYHRTTDWEAPEENLYAFTPNTVFVPKASVSGEMEYGCHGLFRSFVLVNGKMEAFLAAAVEEGYGDIFTSYDNGYSAIAPSLQAYQENVNRVVILGILVYGIILLLFLLLYPGQQGKTLATMESFGANRNRRIVHVLVSAAGIMLPGSLAGAAVGILMWRYVSQALTTEASFTLPVEMNVVGMLWISAAQFVLAELLVLLIGLGLTRKKSLMKRK